ncbi:MAG: DUF4331 domain-containing protein [Mycobacteriaceae bacterium]
MPSAPRTTRSTSRRAVALLASSATLLAVAVVGFAPGTAVASSHREAPLTAGDPKADNTDVYAFVSPDDPNSVTLIANWIPFEEPNGGPNFYPFGTGAEGYTYDVKIDSNGDAKPDLTYRWTFSTQDTRGAKTFLYNNGPVTSLTDENLLFRQTYNLDVIDAAGKSTNLLTNAPVAPSDVGKASMPSYKTDLFDKAITKVTTPQGAGQSFAGQADDPFFLDLRIFDLLYGANLSEVGQDTLAGYNVNTVALKLPKNALALNNNAGNGTPGNGNPVIGVWSTTNRQSVNLADGSVSGDPVQVSRLGQPLVNEVVVPAALKDAFNSLPPTADATAAKGAIVDRVLRPEVPALVASIYGAKAPTGDPGPGQTTNRTDIAEIFLTGVTTKLDGGNFYKGTLGAGTDKAPIPLDLNSQLLNADSSNPKAFQPSEMLRLNMSVPPAAKPSRLGVAGGDNAGFPNGRRLADDVVDIELAGLGGFFLKGQSAQSDTLLAAGMDGVNVNDHAFLPSFPYVAVPNDKSVNKATGGVETVKVPVPGPTTVITAPAAPSATTPAAPGKQTNGNAGGTNAGGTNAGGNNAGGNNAGGDNGVIVTPVGGVDTGAGGQVDGGSSAVPLVSGAVALLLLGAGSAALYRGRRRAHQTDEDQAS